MQKKEKQTTNNVTYMHSHMHTLTHLFFAGNNVYVFKAGGGARREKERRGEVEREEEVEEGGAL